MHPMSPVPVFPFLHFHLKTEENARRADYAPRKDFQGSIRKHHWERIRRWKC